MNWDANIYINRTRISLSDPVYFIADIAANHDGDLNRAKDLIWMAKESGAHCAKFQHFLAEKIVSDYGFRKLKVKQSHQSMWKKSVFEIYKEFECKRVWIDELIKTAQDAQIEFMTTPYDLDIVKVINPFVNAYKIGSGDITWLDFLEQIAKLHKPVILATGASSLSDVKRAVAAITKHTRKLILMQCNTNYTAISDNFRFINLNVLNTFKVVFPNMILGLSDHTLGYTTVLGAVTLGAKVIEKHFTDDNKRVGPDHHFAMNPQNWKEMMERTHELELAMGDGIKRVEQNEEETVVIQRRSLRLKTDKEAGETITADDIEVLRPAPENSYCPYDFCSVVGRILNCNKQKGDCLLKGEIDV